MQKSKELKVALKATKEAGKILMKNYGKVSVQYKKDFSFVTKTDLLSEKKILSIIKKSFPSHASLCEESGSVKRNSNFCWVIDPLDGTANYAIENPFFNVSIALLHKGQPILGVVYNPYTKELFHAEKGKGAYLNGKKIKVSFKKNKRNFVTFGHGKDIKSISKMANLFKKLKKQGIKTRQLGAAALEVCYVSCGRTDAFVGLDTKLWDVAAGTIILREAGGKVSGFSNKESLKFIASSNSKISNKIKSTLAKC